MRRKMTAGSTNQMLSIFIQDTTSTTGAGLGSLVYNSAGLTAKYRRAGAAAWTSITLVTATVGTFTSGGFIADGGGITGGYEIGIPDAAIAAGVPWVVIQFYGATNMLGVQLEIQLDAFDYQVATQKVDVDTIKTGTIAHGGGTVTFPGSSTIASTTNITAATGITVATNSDKTGYSLTAGTGLGNQTADITGNLSGSVGSVTGNVGGNVVGSVASVIGAVGSVTGAVGSVTGNVGGNVVGSVGSVVAAVATTSNIKKNQALSAFQFAMLDDTTKLPIAGKTVTVTRSIDGGAFAAGTLSAVAELSNGLYGVDFGAADLNGNVIVLRATASGCDDTFERIVTQP